MLLPALPGRRVGLFLTALGLLFATVTAAGGAPLLEAAATEEPLPPPPSWLDRLHLSVTGGQMGLAKKLDSYFPNPDNLIFDYRNARLQVKAGGQLDTHGNAIFLQRLDGRIPLPRAQRRLSLYFSGATEPDEAMSEKDQSEKRLVTEPLIADTSMRYGFDTALRLIFSESTVHLVQYQIGIRLLPNFEPYNEINGRLRFSLGKFLVRPGQDLFWRQRQGFGETTLGEVDYPLGEKMIIRLHSEGTVAEESNGLEHRHFVAFLHQLSKRRSYTILFETQGETSPRQRITLYQGSLIWKQKIYRDWLFIEIGPKVVFAAEDSFAAVPAALLLFNAEFMSTNTPPVPRAQLKGDGLNP